MFRIDCQMRLLDGQEDLFIPLDIFFRFKNIWFELPSLLLRIYFRMHPDQIHKVEDGLWGSQWILKFQFISSPKSINEFECSRVGPFWVSKCAMLYSCKRFGLWFRAILCVGLWSLWVIYDYLCFFSKWSINFINPTVFSFLKHLWTQVIEFTSALDLNSILFKRLKFYFIIKFLELFTLNSH